MKFIDQITWFANKVRSLMPRQTPPKWGRRQPQPIFLRAVQWQFYSSCFLYPTLVRFRMSANHSQDDDNKILPLDSTVFIETKNSPLTLRNKGTASLQASVPYSVFTVPQKRWITFVIAFIAWFSTLSSFIYFPALSLIATDLHTSIEGVNLTITSYLIASVIIPSIIAPVADIKGRRPIYIITFSIYFIANTGLALQKSLVGLILLRVVQSVGISGAFAITYGAIADIASPAERGSYVGVVALGFANFSMLGWVRS